MESPTVPKAETVSNRYSTKKWRLCSGGTAPSPLKNRRTEVIRTTEKPDAKMMAIVRPMISRGTRRLKTFTWDRPFIRFQIIRSSSAKLVVLIPPPVEPGEAPMNMRMIITRTVGLVSRPMSTVLNPAVRGEIDWKRESRNCVGPETPFRMWSASNR